MPADDPGAGIPTEVDVRADAGITLATVRGEVDLHSHDRLEQALAPAIAGGGPLVLDLEHVGFMDSTGLHVIVRLARTLAREGRALAVVCTRGEVRRLFELTALDRHLALYESGTEAIEALRRGDVPASAW